jgi:hypothetical protein
VEVRVGEGRAVSAALAGAARTALTGAQEQLAEPEPEALLADTLRSVQKEARWKGASRGRFGQALLEAVVAVEGDESHGGNMPGSPRSGKRMIVPEAIPVLTA